MNLMVPSLFVTSDVASITSVVNSIHRLTNGLLFKGINMILMPICNHGHYFLCVIDLAKNEGYIIDGFNMDTFYTGNKK